MASLLAEACGGCIRVMGRASGPSTRISSRRPDAPTARRRRAAGRLPGSNPRGLCRPPDRTIPECPLASRRRGERLTSQEPPASGMRRRPGSPDWTAATAARVGASPRFTWWHAVTLRWKRMFGYLLISIFTVPAPCSWACQLAIWRSCSSHQVRNKPSPRSAKHAAQNFFACRM